jgi:hypothetical protein
MHPNAGLSSSDPGCCEHKGADARSGADGERVLGVAGSADVDNDTQMDVLTKLASTKKANTGVSQRSLLVWGRHSEELHGLLETSQMVVQPKKPQLLLAVAPIGSDAFEDVEPP